MNVTDFSLLLILTHSSTNFKLKNTLTRRIYLFWLKKIIKSLTWSVRKGHSDVWGVRKIQILSFLQSLQKKPKFNRKTTKFWTTFRFIFFLINSAIFPQKFFKISDDYLNISSDEWILASMTSYLWCYSSCPLGTKWRNTFKHFFCSL